MIEEILTLLWLFLPAGVANMSPVHFKWLPVANYPNHAKKLGKNKTWRGLLAGVVTATLVVYLQQWIALVDYSAINPLILGPLLGAGALIGDAVESFFKRRHGIKPGKPWIPFDQIDWIVGAVVFAEIYVRIGLLEALAVIVIFGLLHPLTNLIGYFLKIRKVKI